MSNRLFIRSWRRRGGHKVDADSTCTHVAVYIHGRSACSEVGRHAHVVQHLARSGSSSGPGDPADIAMPCGCMWSPSELSHLRCCSVLPVTLFAVQILPGHLMNVRNSIRVLGREQEVGLGAGQEGLWRGTVRLQRGDGPSSPPPCRVARLPHQVDQHGGPPAWPEGTGMGTRGDRRMGHRVARTAASLLSSWLTPCV